MDSPFRQRILSSSSLQQFCPLYRHAAAAKELELAAVVEKARAAIKKIAVEEKFDLILENSVYASPNIDITQKVIKALNDQK